jgi:hypothetical protein
MRSRYNPDGSVDYEADRMLEILRQADEELDRQQRAQAQQMAMGATHELEPRSTSEAPTPNKVPTVPTIMDFLKDPIAELARPPASPPLIPSKPNSTTPST